MTIRIDPATLPMQTRAHERDPQALVSSINDGLRTVDVVFSTGAAVRRRRWTGWDTSVPFDEVLTISRASVNLERLLAGAPALDSHSTWSSFSQIGVVDRAWVEEGANPLGLATIRFPTAGIDAAADRMFGLVRDKIIRNLSVGYTIDKVRLVAPEKVGDVEQRIVERWTPYEISFVTVPADFGAQVRSLEPAALAQFPCDIVHAGGAEATRLRMRMRQAAIF
jgi:hypothetical protein